jgi:hypothetical protein
VEWLDYLVHPARIVTAPGLVLPLRPSPAGSPRCHGSCRMHHRDGVCHLGRRSVRDPHESNPYAAPRSCHEPKTRPAAKVDSKNITIRRVAGLAVRFVWLCSLPVLSFGMLYAPRDGHPWQIPAAIWSSLCFLFAVALTAVHWLLVVPFSVILARRVGHSADAEAGSETAPTRRGNRNR